MKTILGILYLCLLSAPSHAGKIFCAPEAAKSAVKQVEPESIFEPDSELHRVQVVRNKSLESDFSFEGFLALINMSGEVEDLVSLARDFDKKREFHLGKPTGPNHHIEAKYRVEGGVNNRIFRLSKIELYAKGHSTELTDQPLIEEGVTDKDDELVSENLLWVTRTRDSSGHTVSVSSKPFEAADAEKHIKNATVNSQNRDDAFKILSENKDKLSFEDQRMLSTVESDDGHSIVSLPFTISGPLLKRYSKVVKLFEFLDREELKVKDRRGLSVLYAKYLVRAGHDLVFTRGIKQIGKWPTSIGATTLMAMAIAYFAPGFSDEWKRMKKGEVLVSRKNHELNFKAILTELVPGWEEFDAKLAKEITKLEKNKKKDKIKNSDDDTDPVKDTEKEKTVVEGVEDTLDLINQYKVLENNQDGGSITTWVREKGKNFEEVAPLPDLQPGYTLTLFKASKAIVITDFVKNKDGSVSTTSIVIKSKKKNSELFNRLKEKIESVSEKAIQVAGS